MLQILAIDHLVLRTENIDAMREFYTQTLGCRVERDELDDLGLLQLRAGNALIDLVAVDSLLGRPGGGPPTTDNNNLDHFCLRIAALSNDLLLSYLQSKSVACEEFAPRNGAQGVGDSIYIRDPDGNRVELKGDLTPT